MIDYRYLTSFSLTRTQRQASFPGTCLQQTYALEADKHFQQITQKNDLAFQALVNFCFWMNTSRQYSSKSQL